MWRYFSEEEWKRIYFDNQQSAVHFDMNMQQGSMNNTIGIQILTDYNYVGFVNEDSEQRLIEDYGANMHINLRDGR